jgi:type I restriction enzyme S subunit
MMSSLQSTVYGDFAADYESSRLVDICEPKEGVQTGPFGSQLHQEDYVPVGTPIITVEHLGENRILHSDIPRVSEEDRERLSKYTLFKGDIVFSRVGSVDRRAIVRDEEDGWLFSGRCLRVRPNQSMIDPGYLSYFFGLPTFKEYIRAIAVGATMPSLNTKILSDVSIYYPPLPEQRAIAHILGTLDDKIELNRRMNETLEAMARAIFKSWFVDFDPVRAKSEGRDTGLPEEIADLFPDSFEETELGEVPEGWEVGTLGNYANLNPESWSKDKFPESIMYVDLANTKWGTIDSTSIYLWKDAPSRAQRVLRIGDTIIGTVRPGNGSYSIISENGLTGSTGFAVLRPSNEDYISFVYLAVTDKDNIERLAHLADGGAYPAIRPDVVLATPVVYAKISVLECFARRVKPLIDKIEGNKRESRTLAKLRDTLLPKLISGELRIDNTV